MKLRTAVLFLVLTFLYGCAGQRLPEGGPVDSEPPEIVSVYPQPGTVNFTGTSIIIEFSEYVDRRTTEEAIFISPNIEEKEFDWSGPELEIIFHEELRKNTTYVVSIGTDVIDIRAQNRMTNAFALSFSTGTTIDNGRIEGKVFDEKADGVMLYAYRLNEIRPDTLNPSVTKPDYLSQAGKNGEFSLKNIAPGTYRLFAIRDDYRNLLYEPEIDAAGTTSDITISRTDSLRKGIQFIIAKEDTTAPRLAQVQAPDNRHLTVQFSEEMDSASVMSGAFVITDTVYSQTLAVTGIFPRDDSYKTITVITAEQKKDERYVLTVSNVRDRARHSINPSANAMQFTGASVGDSAAPVLSATSIKDQSARVLPDEQITLYFNDALRWPIADTAVVIRRLKDSSRVPLTFIQRNLSSFILRQAKPWTIGEQYLLQFRWSGMKDLSGNSGKDTTESVKFTADDPENYGSIEGSFAGFSPSATIIQAENILDKKQLPKKAKATSAGNFVFTGLPEGKYVLKAFDDVNSNLLHDAGTVYPFRLAERFTNYSDTIRVRPRWPVDGVFFKVP